MLPILPFLSSFVMSVCDLVPSTYLANELYSLGEEKDDILNLFPHTLQSTSSLSLDDGLDFGGEAFCSMEILSEEPAWFRVASTEKVSEMPAIESSIDFPSPVIGPCLANETAITEPTGELREASGERTSMPDVDSSPLRMVGSCIMEEVLTTADPLKTAAKKEEYHLTSKSVQDSTVTMDITEVTGTSELLSVAQGSSPPVEGTATSYNGPSFEEPKQAHLPEPLQPPATFDAKKSEPASSLHSDSVSDDQPGIIAASSQSMASDSKDDQSTVSGPGVPTSVDIAKCGEADLPAPYGKSESGASAASSDRPAELNRSRSLSDNDLRKEQERTGPNVSDGNSTMADGEAIGSGSCHNASRPSSSSIEDALGDRVMTPASSKNVEEPKLCTPKQPASTATTKFKRPFSSKEFRVPPSCKWSMLNGSLKDSEAENKSLAFGRRSFMRNSHVEGSSGKYPSGSRFVANFRSEPHCYW